MTIRPIGPLLCGGLLMLAIVAFVVIAPAIAQIPGAIYETRTKPIFTLAEAKKMVRADRNKIWKDSDSIKDARIATPASCYSSKSAVSSTPGYFGQQTFSAQTTMIPATCVCLDLNAKNSYGGYAGLSRTFIYYPERDEMTVVSGDTSDWAQYCQGFSPFPELNGRKK